MDKSDRATSARTSNARFLFWSLNTAKLILVERVLGLGRPGARAGFHHVGVPVLAVGRRVVDLEHVRVVDLREKEYIKKS